MDVRTLMRQAVEFNANRPCVITETCELTFAEMWERGCRLANGLLALGLQSWPGRERRVAGS